MAQRETNILKLCMVAAAECGAVVWRNNIGQYKDGQRVIRYGVCNPGGADLIGLTDTGKFLAIEIKRPGELPRPAQAAFLDAIRRMGGIAFVATCPKDVYFVLKK